MKENKSIDSALRASFYKMFNLTKNARKIGDELRSIKATRETILFISFAFLFLVLPLALLLFLIPLSIKKRTKENELKVVEEEYQKNIENIKKEIKSLKNDLSNNEILDIFRDYIVQEMLEGNIKREVIYDDLTGESTIVRKATFTICKKEIRSKNIFSFEENKIQELPSALYCYVVAEILLPRVNEKLMESIKNNTLPNSKVHVTLLNQKHINSLLYESTVYKNIFTVEALDNSDQDTWNDKYEAENWCGFPNEIHIEQIYDGEKKKLKKW